jgi:hypothetical protein
MKFEDATLCVLLDRLDLLKRKPNIEQDYTDYKQNLTMNGITATDVVLKKMKGMPIKWVRNDFPYDVDGTRHYLIWSTTPLDNEQIDDIAKRHVKGREFIRFVNPMNLRSIRDLWHAHVIVKM